MGLQVNMLKLKKPVTWPVWALDAVKFNLEATFGNDFSRRVDLEGS